MRKFIITILPIITLVSFIFIMNSDILLKQPLTTNDDIPGSLQLVMVAVENEQWEDANIKTNNLSESWQKVVNRVQFSAEKNEINAFNTNLARLRGAIATKDKSCAIIELSEAYEHWANLSE